MASIEVKVSMKGGRRHHREGHGPHHLTVARAARRGSRGIRAVRVVPGDAETLACNGLLGFGLPESTGKPFAQKLWSAAFRWAPTAASTARCTETGMS
jgi:hypothetical protein